MRDILESFNWHSSIGIDDTIDGNKKFISRLRNTRKARGLFLSAGDSLLIHRATKALWKVSDDGKYIEPVFDTDVLSEEDLEEEK
jgi:hypothetical protein